MSGSGAEFARKYADMSVWQFDRGLAMLDFLPPSKGGITLDLGCGTGALSVELARRIGPAGQVFAIDPDEDRLKLARSSIPSDVTNLTFSVGRAERLAFVDDASLDLIFSNYAVQWVIDQEAMLREIERCLKPGARFMTEFLGTDVDFLLDLMLLMPDGEKARALTRFNDDRDWRRMIAEAGLDIELLDWLSPTLDFASVPALYGWLEGTSHGVFRRELMPADAKAAFEARFHAGVSI